MTGTCLSRSAKDWVRAFDYWNCFLQTGPSGMPWTVGNVQRISAIRAPATAMTCRSRPAALQHADRLRAEPCSAIGDVNFSGRSDVPLPGCARCGAARSLQVPADLGSGPPTCSRQWPRPMRPTAGRRGIRARGGRHEAPSPGGRRCRRFDVGRATAWAMPGEVARAKSRRVRVFLGRLFLFRAPSR